MSDQTNVSGGCIAFIIGVLLLVVCFKNCSGVLELGSNAIKVANQSLSAKLKENEK